MDQIALCLNEVDRLIDDLTDKHAHQSPKGVMEHVAKDLGLKNPCNGFFKRLALVALSKYPSAFHDYGYP
jgi:hypothetical protein